jgi:hypothetical protein
MPRKGRWGRSRKLPRPVQALYDAEGIPRYISKNGKIKVKSKYRKSKAYDPPQPTDPNK